MITAGQSTPHSAALNMLVLDDSEFDRRNLCRLGEKTGLPIAIQTAPSLSAMKRKIHQTAFDLILVDYSLPDGDGFQALELVRNDPHNRNSALIMVSGREQVDLAVQAMRRGCESYLCKSALTPETLRHTILEATEHRIATTRMVPLPAQSQLSAGLADLMEVALQRLDFKQRIDRSPGFAEFLQGIADQDDEDPFLT